MVKREVSYISFWEEGALAALPVLGVVCKPLVGLLVCKGAADFCAYNTVLNSVLQQMSMSVSLLIKNGSVLIARFHYLNELKEFEKFLCIPTAERLLLKKNCKTDILNFPFKFMCSI